MKAKLTTNEKLNKIFPTVKVLWANVTDEDCCSYINSMVHTLCGHYELYEDIEQDYTISIDADFVNYWMELCNSNGLELIEVKKYYNETLAHFYEINNDSYYDYVHFEQKKGGCAFDEIAHEN